MKNHLHKRAKSNAKQPVPESIVPKTSVDFQKLLNKPTKRRK